MKIDVAKRLRIAVLIRHYDRSGGGAERYCVELTERLAEIHEVHVFAQQVSTQSPNITFHDIPLHLKRPRFLNQLLFSRDTRKATEGQYDLVHSHDMVTHANVYTLHVPCVKTRWSQASLPRKAMMALGILTSPRKIAYLWLEQQELQPLHNRHFITVSEYLSRNILVSYPKLRAHITVAHPGISATPPSDTERMQLRKVFREQHQIPHNSFILLFVAHGFIRKGLPTIIRALEQLNKENLYLLVAGRGVPEQIQFTNPKAKERTLFLGTVQQMEQLYPVADALVHPTLGDTYGMAALEAISSKIALIISNQTYCGLSEHLDTSNAILLSNPKDATELSNVIKQLYNSPDYCNQIAEAGYQTASTINWSSTLSHTLHAYRQLTTHQNGS